MITWQHVENAKQLMTALALVEARGGLPEARQALATAQRTAKGLTERDGYPTHAIEVLALKIKMAAEGSGPDRALVLYFMAALALELGLEADDQARADALALVARGTR